MTHDMTTPNEPSRIVRQYIRSAIVERIGADPDVSLALPLYMIPPSGGSPAPAAAGVV